ncbi:hypothetical protein BHE74_00021782 [Ensete ventricosum]|uniref:Uncharacterized protein n=1 Tax=Ensete ventricosum TaxID=4639 RepID=A0A444FYT5_ENSVE|nr:hypothetical protein B296_00000403 [Ensete ventricosum]RWW27814.1 hypothetical protein GW17_00007739 [Ensete ventricosum]RWW70521.1 hypothetical protein BHE74_00021782 [Ensete ventricosum]RZR77054.1 hypothetical protein BHM03_00002030 [Ensete ventricosum]
MALCAFNKKALKPNGYALDLENIKLDFNWEDVTCSICLDFPHNGVLLLCSSHDKGCRPFMCDTGKNHANCLERFISAYGVPAVVEVTAAANGVYMVCIQETSASPSSQPTCPLCRGNVTGWLIIDEARANLNMMKRCCEERHCTYVGNFSELQKHAQLKHPYSYPAKIDPAHKLNWENFQQSSEIIDVLSTIHAEAPHAVVMGDYVIEYDDSEFNDEYEHVHTNRGKWWTSCISCKLFPNFRGSRNQRRSRRGPRSSRRSNSDGFFVGEGSSRSVEIREYRFAEADDELAQIGADAGVGSATSLVIPSHYRWDYS